MPYTIEKYPNEPIIILSFEGYITANDVTEAFHESNTELAVAGRPAYQIADMTAVTDLALDDIMAVTQYVFQGNPMVPLSQRVTSVLIGSDTWKTVYLEFLNSGSTMATHIPFYRSLDDALRFIRLQIQANRR